MSTFSIVTVNLNNKDGLKKTIESILSQDTDDYELIVIDGASVDGSLDVIQEYSDKISYWVSEPDAGPYDAMNKGIEKASGKYLHFLNSGDYYYSKEVLSSIKSKAENFEIIWGNTCYVYPNKRILTKFDPNDPITALSLENYGCINHQAVFIKSDIIKNCGYNLKYKVLADYDFFYNKIICQKCSVKRVDDIVVYFETNGMSNNPQYADIAALERKNIRAKFLPGLVIDDYDDFSYFVRDPEFYKLFKKILLTRNIKSFLVFLVRLVVLFIKRFFYSI